MKENSLISVFVVEDDEVFLKALTHHLNQVKRYKVTTFVSGEACLERMTRNPDIVILDLNLKGIAGIDTLKKIKQIKPDTYVIICSEQDDMQTTLDVMKEGAYEYIIKNENSATRIKNCISNIIKNEDVKSENLELKLRISKYKLYLLVVLVVAVVLGGLTWFLNRHP